MKSVLYLFDLSAFTYSHYRPFFPFMQLTIGSKALFAQFSNKKPFTFYDTLLPTVCGYLHCKLLSVDLPTGYCAP